MLLTNQNQRLCIPGERLFALDEGYAAGHGCYEIHGFVHAALAGVIQVTLNKQQVRRF